MNGAMIIYILGQVLRIEGLLMLPSFLVGLIYAEKQGWAFLFMGAVCLVVGTLMSLKKPRNTMIYLKEGCVSTALCWIVLSAFGAVPFVLTGEIPVFTDAMFETAAGADTVVEFSVARSMLRCVVGCQQVFGIFLLIQQKRYFRT